MFIINHFEIPEFVRMMAESGNYAEGPKQVAAAAKSGFDASPGLLGISEIAEKVVGEVTDKDKKYIFQFMLRDLKNAEEYDQRDQIIRKLRGRLGNSHNPLLRGLIISCELENLFYASIGGFLPLNKGDKAQTRSLIEDGYSVYQELLEAFLQYPIHNHDLFARMVNGLVHFWGPYSALTEPTERNRVLAHKLLAKLVAAELKILPTITTEKLGRFFTAPRMIRELLIHAALKYGLPVFQSLVETALAAHDEYVVSARVFEPRRGHANLVLSGQRQNIDYLLHNGTEALFSSLNEEIPDVIKKVFSNSMYLGLLNDTARILLINTFGSSNERLGQQPGVVHIKFVILSEASSQACVAILQGSQCHISYCPVFHGSLNELALLLEQACREEDPTALTKAVEFLRAVFDEAAIAFLSQREDVTMIALYPDGNLWRLPWQWLIRSLPTAFPECGVRGLTDHPVVIKIGDRSLQPKPKVMHATLMAGWNYGNPEIEARLLRRGVSQRGVIPNLPGAKEEIKRIESLIANRWPSTITENPDAQDVLSAMPKLTHPSIVHLACHGTIHDSQALPNLVLPSNRPSEPCTFLHFESILRVSWANCRLLFLNACFGGYGRPHVGALPTGLHEAFVIAGVPNFLAPLWPVWDDIAAEFAEMFYSLYCKSQDLFQAYEETATSLSSDSDPRRAATIMAYQLYSM